jgi:hypothetical protein
MSQRNLDSTFPKIGIPGPSIDPRMACRFPTRHVVLTGRTKPSIPHGSTVAPLRRKANPVATVASASTRPCRRSTSMFVAPRLRPVVTARFSGTDVAAPRIQARPVPTLLLVRGGWRGLDGQCPGPAKTPSAGGWLSTIATGTRQAFLFRLRLGARHQTPPGCSPKYSGWRRSFRDWRFPVW